MHLPRVIYIIILITLMGMVFGCSALPGSNRFDRTALLTSISQDMALPLYTDFARHSQILSAAVQALQANPTVETLAAAQTAWREAALTWEQTEVLAFGAEMTLITPIDKWPTRTSFIDEQIAGTEPLTQATVASFGSTSKGLPALEYLLFDPELDETALLTRLQNEPRRLEYAVAAAQVLAQDAEALVAVWSSEGYGTTFVEGGTLANEDVQSSVSMAVNEMVAVLETMVREELSPPLGSRTYGQPVPEQAEGWRSGTSRANLVANLNGLNQLFDGNSDGALGFDDYLTAQGAMYGEVPLADAINTQWQAALSAVEAIPEPLHTQVVDNPDAVIRARDEITKLLVLVKSDMASQLGVTITFNDNDGD